MLLLLLQWLGGGLYLLNKVFLSFSEHAKSHQRPVAAKGWRIASWIVYVVGLPAWVIVFLAWNNFIAAFVEASGFPAMILGLVMSIRGVDTYKAPRLLHLTTIVCIVAGFWVSLSHFHGLTNFRQWLEIGLVSGFLIGTYKLAKEQASGYLWFVLMHVSCGLLAFAQHAFWLVAQQVVSLGFILHAYITSSQRQGTFRECRQLERGQP